jgi:hypothetical protein
VLAPRHTWNSGLARPTVYQRPPRFDRVPGHVAHGGRQLIPRSRIKADNFGIVSDTNSTVPRYRTRARQRVFMMFLRDL